MMKKLSLMIVLSIIIMSVILPVYAKSPDGEKEPKIYKTYTVTYKEGYIPASVMYINNGYSGKIYLKRVSHNNGFVDATYEGFIYTDVVNPYDKNGSKVYLEKLGDGYRIRDKRSNPLDSDTVLLDLNK